MKNISVFLLSVTAFLITISPVGACTGFKLKAKDGNTVHGRTFEFGVKVDTSVVVIPAEYPFVAATPKGNGLSYKSKYAVVGTICFDRYTVLDGINEKGLSVGTFYFPGYAAYSETTEENQKYSLSPLDFPNWIVTQFATIEEIKNNLHQVVIAPTVSKQWGNEPPPFHYIVYDKAGHSIVIEPINGKFVVHENPLGVLTNAPTFGWHMTNLRNFINLTPFNVAPLTIDNLVLAPFGQGSGMVGMPGDFTPPSRFVRAAIYSITAVPSEDVNAAVLQAFHILNQFDIPVGIARQVEDDVVQTDYTLATVVHDPINTKYYFKTYEDQSIRSVDLRSFDKNSTAIMSMGTSGSQSYTDVSKELKPVNRLISK